MNDALTSQADRLQLLHTFVRIVETGNLSSAALQLGTSQPTVSRRLQALEKLLGLRLLQRSTHTLRLTEDGERCFAHARELLGTWEAMQSDLRGARDVPRGTLRVMVPHAFGQDQLIAPLTEFLRQHPDVSVEWLLQDRLPDFIAEGIDCAIRVGRVDEPGVVAVRLAEVPRIVVAAPAVAAALPGPQAGPAELERLPWLALHTFYRDEVALARAPGAIGADGASGADSLHRFAIRPRLSTDSLYAVRQAALAGLGACIVSRWVVLDDLARGRLVHLAPQWQAPPLPVYLIYPPARWLPARLRAFSALMRECMPQLTGMQPVT
ncbi:MAG: LysR family transcriptional regulator [Burkholderiaceae bacterium]|nr:LysR family transcriptional regulator [Burkholderiaceae bacterium]